MTHLVETGKLAPVMQPTIARLKPCLIALKAGRTYYWCRCGLSAKQPFCDGSHKGTGFEPLKHVAAADDEVLFCGCKHTKTPPFCDGSHSNLPGGSPLDDPDTAENRTIGLVSTQTGARRMLNGDCYVFSPARAELLRRGSLEFCEVISNELGALYQTQILMRVKDDPSPVMAFGESHAILFVSAGAGTVTICGRSFEVSATDGVYIRPGEAFQLAARGNARFEVYASACPRGGIEWLEEMPQSFDATCPQRVVSVDVEQRTAMGPRYFQCLVDKRIGSNVITQFIGHIPQSKAAPHRHLYEEAILVLRGEGCMWTEDRKTNVSTGDVIFLPRKQVHSLQATAPDGMDVVGVIYPGDNPSINY